MRILTALRTLSGHHFDSRCPPFVSETVSDLISRCCLQHDLSDCESPVTSAAIFATKSHCCYQRSILWGNSCCRPLQALWRLYLFQAQGLSKCRQYVFNSCGVYTYFRQPFERWSGRSCLNNTDTFFSRATMPLYPTFEILLLLSSPLFFLPPFIYFCIIRGKKTLHQHFKPSWWQPKFRLALIYRNAKCERD